MPGTEMATPNQNAIWNASKAGPQSSQAGIIVANNAFGLRLLPGRWRGKPIVVKKKVTNNLIHARVNHRWGGHRPQAQGIILNWRAVARQYLGGSTWCKHPSWVRGVQMRPESHRIMWANSIGIAFRTSGAFETLRRPICARFCIKVTFNMIPEFFRTKLFSTFLTYSNLHSVVWNLLFTIWNQICNL